MVQECPMLRHPILAEVLGSICHEDLILECLPSLFVLQINAGIVQGLITACSKHCPKVPTSPTRSISCETGTQANAGLTPMLPGDMMLLATTAFWDFAGAFSRCRMVLLISMEAMTQEFVAGPAEHHLQPGQLHGAHCSRDPEEAGHLRPCQGIRCHHIGCGMAATPSPPQLVNVR